MKKKLEAERMETQPAQSAPKEEDSSYIFPPVTMLASGKKVDAAVETEELQTNGKLLVETLKSFGVQTKILDICRGPAVTRYELQPAAGVKISKITNLADDLAMNLAATGVRIEAPIPGKAAVGIEVPNKVKTIVRMREACGIEQLCDFKKPLDRGAWPRHCRSGNGGRPQQNAAYPHCRYDRLR